MIFKETKITFSPVTGKAKVRIGRRDKRFRVYSWRPKGKLNSVDELDIDRYRLNHGLKPIVQDRMLYGYLSSLMLDDNAAYHTLVTLTFRDILGIPKYKPGMTIVDHAVSDFKSNLYRNNPTKIIILVEERGENTEAIETPTGRYHLHAVVQWGITDTVKYRGFKYPLDLVEALNMHELKYGFVYPSKVSHNTIKSNSKCLSYVLKYVLKEGGRNWL